MAADYDRHTAEPVGARRLQMPLDEDVIRLAKGKNLATVVTLMPSGQPQALLTWIDTDGELVLVNTEPQRRLAGAGPLPKALRHVERVTDRPPDHLGVFAVRQRAFDGAAAELVEHVVLGHTLGVRVAELRLHPVPECRQTHAARVLSGAHSAARRGRLGADAAAESPLG